MMNPYYKRNRNIIIELPNCAGTGNLQAKCQYSYSKEGMYELAHCENLNIRDPG